MLALTFGGCSSGEPLDPGTLVLTTGQETDTWIAEPAPVDIEVDRIDDSGARTHHASLKPPATRVTMTQLGVATFEVHGNDESGTTRVFGRSLPIDTGSFAGSALPLFVSRTGAFARPPGDFAAPPGDGVIAAPLGHRYLMVASTAPKARVELDAYDFGAWAPLGSGPHYVCDVDPCRFTSLAFVGSTALALGEGLAVWFDVQTLASGHPDLPTGLSSYDDVQGGASISGPDDSTYIVGATRASNPTRAVLKIAKDGVLSALELVAARAGGAAIYVSGRGLVVVGGSADGAGVEILPDGATTFVQLGYPADPTAGAALAMLDAATLLRAGGKDATGSAAATVTLALDCGSPCAPAPRGDPIELDRASGFGFDDGRALVVGARTDGQMGAQLLTDTGATEVTLRDPRSDAFALLAPTGHVAVIGGIRADGTEAPSVELFAP